MTTPAKSILDRSFAYRPSTATSVQETWRKFGWRPKDEQAPNVTPIQKVKKA